MFYVFGKNCACVQICYMDLTVFVLIYVKDESFVPFQRYHGEDVQKEDQPCEYGSWHHAKGCPAGAGVQENHSRCGRRVRHQLPHASPLLHQNPPRGGGGKRGAPQLRRGLHRCAAGLQPRAGGWARRLRFTGVRRLLRTPAASDSANWPTSWPRATRCKHRPPGGRTNKPAPTGSLVS